MRRNPSGGSTVRRMTVSQLVILGALLLSLAPAASGGVTISAERVGRVFYPGERPRLMVIADCERQLGSYRAIDYSGREWIAGSAYFGGGSVTQLDMGQALPLGWYRLRLIIGNEMIDDAFCVLPMPQSSTRGNDGLFNLQVNTRDERQWAAAAQMGVRAIRNDLSWPTYERVEGQLDMSQFREEVRLACKYGIQLMVCAGYTPAWNAVAPQNGPDDWMREAPFIQHPRDAERWRIFVQTAIDETRGKSVLWPSRAILPENVSYEVQQLPVVQSLEVWNEADHLFYLGTWSRYMDLVKIAHGVLKSAYPDAEVIYGGATGNWLTMCLTCANQVPLYFDRMAFHGSGSVARNLTAWAQGMQQLPWIDGYPRETSINESYLMYKDTGGGYDEHQQMPGDIFRVRTQLMFWQQDSHYRSSCLHQWVANPTDAAAQNAMLLEKNGGLCPTPLYAAFAAARYWLTNATYVGPLDISENVEAHILMHGGRPMLIAWSDDGQNVSVTLGSWAVRITEMGQERRLPRTHTLRTTLSRSPLMVLGVDDAYLGIALRNRYELFANTAFGNDTGPGGFYGLGKLMVDATTWTKPGFEQRVNRAIAAACEGLSAGGSGGPVTIREAMAEIEQGMLDTANTCLDNGSVSPRAIATMYRLARVEEWLAQIADERSMLWPATSTCGDIAGTAGMVASLRAELPEGEAQAVAHFADQLLDRARNQLKLAQQMQGSATVMAAQSEAAVAEKLMLAEDRRVRTIFPVADFPTMIQLRKAFLLEAGQSHTMCLRMHSFVGQDVSGVLRLSIPETWIAEGAMEQPFSVEANGVSAPVEFCFRIPGGPEPWQKMHPTVPDSWLDVEVPDGLEVENFLRLDGVLDDGTPLVGCVYRVFIGRMMDGDSDVSSCPEAQGVDGLSGTIYLHGMEADSWGFSPNALYKQRGF